MFEVIVSVVCGGLFLASAYCLNCWGKGVDARLDRLDVEQFELSERVDALEESQDCDGPIPDMAQVLEGFKKSEGAIPLQNLLKVASKAVEIALEQVHPCSTNDALRSYLREAGGNLNDAAETLGEMSQRSLAEPSTKPSKSLGMASVRKLSGNPGQLNCQALR